MRNRIIILAILFTISIFSRISAQSFGAYGIGPIAPTVAQCPTGVTNQAYLCPVGSGSTFQMYISYSGGAYMPLTSSTGVTSFNGRTGAVLPVANDYTYPQLSNKPVSQNCSTATHSNTGLTASGCVYQ